jgi:hypothetical protein
MAEAGQKDQTGNEAVNLDNTEPTSLEEITGISKPGGPQSAVTQEVSQPQDTPKADDTANAQTAQPQQQAQAPVQPKKNPDADAAPKSKFLDNEWQSMMLRQAWHVEEIDPEFTSILKNLTKNKNDGLTFETENGKFIWGYLSQQNSSGGFDSVEYVGMPSRFSKMTQEIAGDLMLAAKAHGWGSVNAHGPEHAKEKIWLAAMRAGLEVDNFFPSENSEVLKIWKKESAEITGVTNAPPSQPVDQPKTQEPPKTDAPETAEPAKNDAAEAPAVATPTDTAPVVEEPKAAEPPKTDAPATAEPPKAEEPTAAAATQEEKPAAPVASKFGTAEPPKTDAPKAAEPAKANPAHAEWEERKALYSSKPEGVEVSYEGRMSVEAVEGMTKRAATVQDPAHRAGIEKLQDAIKSGKVSVDGPIEREIINNVDSPKGFQKAADYFGKKASSDLGLPKLDAPAAAENSAPQNKPPKNKGPA